VVDPREPLVADGRGVFAGGTLAFVADAALAGAVFTTLPTGTQLLSSDTPDGGDLFARATVEQRGRTIAVSTARIEDADGRLVAMASGSSMISEGRPWPTRAG